MHGCSVPVGPSVAFLVSISVITVHPDLPARRLKKGAHCLLGEHDITNTYRSTFLGGLTGQRMRKTSSRHIFL